MALIASGTQGSGPQWAWQLHATQTGGSGNSRTVKVEMWIKINAATTASKYAYSLQWKGRVEGSYSGWIHVKGNETWYGGMDWKKYSWTQTIDVGTTSSKAITVGFQLDRPDGTSSVEMTKTGSFTVGVTNTPPYFTSGEKWLRTKNATASGTVLSGIIPENVSNLYMDWGYASDKEGGTLTYILQRQENGGGWVTVDTGTDRAHAESFPGGSGTSRRYWVTVKDSTGAQAAEGIYGATVTKNTLTGGWFTGHSNNVYFDTASFRLDFTGGKNANGAGVEYSCYSDKVTIHNQKWTSTGNQTIYIWKSGAYPNAPYIKWEELKAAYKNSNYAGPMHVGLRTRNAYGTIKYAGGQIQVNIAKAPNAATGVAVQRNSNSTAWVNIYKVGEPPQPVQASYLRPYRGTYVQIRWTRGTTSLGESFTQVVQFCFSDEPWQDLATLDSGATSFNHYMPEQTKQRTAEYRVVTKSSLGTAYSGKASSVVDYYDEGKVGVVKLEARGETTATIEWSHPTNTSMSAVDSYTSWALVGTSKQGVFNGFSSKRTVNLTDLSPDRSYTFEVRFDARNAPGGAHGIQVAITIPKQTPVFFVNRHGVGVAGGKASDFRPFYCNGRGYFEGSVRLQGDFMPADSSSDANSITTPGQFRYQTTSAANAAGNTPNGVAGYMEVKPSAGVTQEYTEYHTGHKYIRGWYGYPSGTETWTPWKRLLDSGMKTREYKAVGYMAESMEEGLSQTNGKYEVFKYNWRSGFMDYYAPAPGKSDAPYSSAWNLAIQCNHRSDNGGYRYGFYIVHKLNTAHMCLRTQGSSYGDGNAYTIYNHGNPQTFSESARIVIKGSMKRREERKSTYALGEAMTFFSDSFNNSIEETFETMGNSRMRNSLLRQEEKEIDEVRTGMTGMEVEQYVEGLEYLDLMSNALKEAITKINELEREITLLKNNSVGQ